MRVVIDTNCLVASIKEDLFAVQVVDLKTFKTICGY